MKPARIRTALTLLAVFCCLLAPRAWSAETAPLSAREWERRGSNEFLAGKIHDSIRSFESAVKLRPDRKAHLWQLGIAYYYAERFADGRDLFELHQTVNTQDVENAVWHFLCVARLEGVEAARKKLIPISGDTRVPMKQVHALFAGRAKPEDVLAAAEAEKDPNVRKNSLCYAHLYLALFEEARGNQAKSNEHIARAAGEFRQPHYMGEVARIHSALRGSPDKASGVNR